MSMTCQFVAIEPDKLDELRDDPEGALDFMDQAREEGDEERSLDIDKAWHGIHFLLNDSAYQGEGPGAYVIFGSETIGGDMEEPVEPIVRYITSTQVYEAAAFLSDISVPELAERYDPDAMEAAEIYPVGIWEEERQEAFDYVAQYYEMLVEFFEGAAERGDAIISSIG